MLVGLGVVGRAILAAHIRAGIDVWISDADPDACKRAAIELSDAHPDYVVEPVRLPLWDLPVFSVWRQRKKLDRFELEKKTHDPILIESIAERLDVKQEFFDSAMSMLGSDWVYCSNTSTLRIEKVAEQLPYPNRLCGMHFFMPVDDRTAVEVIASKKTESKCIDRCFDHVLALQKQPLLAVDSPGFIVNRMLSPYLNEAMVLLTEGATDAQIENAAKRFGMPLSPLELSDAIGSRTMFDAGRVYWQSFPNRIDPSPLLPALLKAKRGGRDAGGGFYDYESGARSESISNQAVILCNRYTRSRRTIDEDEVLCRLSIPMWIESALLLKDGVAKNRDDVETAMAGGLGYTRPDAWYDFFDALGSKRMLTWIDYNKQMKTPETLVELLETNRPSAAVDRYFKV